MLLCVCFLLAIAPNWALNISCAHVGAGKSASGLKEVTDSFAEGLAEGSVEADKLKTAAPSVMDTTAVKEDEKQAAESRAGE